MKIKFFFTLLMIGLSALTMLKYKEINDIKANSREFTFVVRGDEDKITHLKADIQNITFQPVNGEQIEEGRYRIKIRCPPDKINSILSRFAQVQKEMENE